MTAAPGRGGPTRGPEPMRTYRVVQWSTGSVGSIALGAIAARPDLSWSASGFTRPTRSAATRER